MMVMPLGPDFARALAIPSSQLGYIAGAYTAAAAVAGVATSLFLDRFGRRGALTVAMLGLALGTAAGAFARGLPSLLAARVLAGLFGGPATSLSFSIVADVVPAPRRGKAMGTVMGAFAIASIAGVPAGLELSQRGGWRLPFFAVAGAGLVVTALAATRLPPLVGHLAAHGGAGPPPFARLLRQPVVLLAWATTALAMMGGFILIPNISAYVQHNLGYPRARLDLLYLAGGVVSFFATRAAGRLVDRYGSFRVGSLGAAALAVTVWVGFAAVRPDVPVIAVFVAFFLAMALRNVAWRTMTNKVPAPAERARFMSIDSSVSHLAAATGAFVSARMLSERPDHGLDGLPWVAAVQIGLTALLPLLLWAVERRVAGTGDALLRRQR